jgi:hypothetical protein
MTMRTVASYSASRDAAEHFRARCPPRRDSLCIAKLCRF